MPSFPMPSPAPRRGAFILPLLGMLVLAGWGAPLAAQGAVASELPPGIRPEAHPGVAACEARLAWEYEPRTPLLSGVRISPEQGGFLLVTGTLRTEPPGSDGGTFACLVPADGSRVLALVPPVDQGGVRVGTGMGAGTPAPPAPTLSPARLQACQGAVARAIEARDGVRPIFSSRPRGESAEDGRPRVVGAMTIPHTGRAPSAQYYHCTLDPATGEVQDLRFSPDPGAPAP